MCRTMLVNGKLPARSGVLDIINTATLASWWSNPLLNINTNYPDSYSWPFTLSRGRSLPNRSSLSYPKKMLKGGRLSTHQNKCIKLCIKKTWWNTQICLVEWQKCNKFSILLLIKYLHLTLLCNYWNMKYAVWY